MKRALAIVVLLLVGCGAPPENLCTTRNKLVVWYLPNGWCAEIQAVEDTIFNDAAPRLEAFDPRFAQAREITAGYRVQMLGIGWLNAQNIAIKGETDCRAQLISINNSHPAHGTFAHEMMHAIQRCQPTEPWDRRSDQAYFHSNWGEIYRVLREVNLAP